MVTTTDTSIWERNPFTSETNNKTPGALQSVLFLGLKKDESKSNYFSLFLPSSLSLLFFWILLLQHLPPPQ